jgi:hypothetical protein
MQIRFLSQVFVPGNLLMAGLIGLLLITGLLMALELPLFTLISMPWLTKILQLFLKEMMGESIKLLMVGPLGLT